VFIKIIQLLSLLNKEQKRNVLLIQFMIVVLAGIEIGSVALIVPLIAVISDSDLIESNSVLNSLYHQFSFADANSFFIFLGVLVFSAILLSSLTGILAHFLITRFGFQLGRTFSSHLFSHFMQKDYLFHTRTNSSVLINKISKQVDRVTMGLILPFLQINSRLFMVTCMSLLLVLIDPMLVLTTSVVLVSAYALIFKGTRKILAANGQAITKSTQATFQSLNEGFGGVKEIKFLGKEATYVRQFDQAANDYARAATVSQVVPVIPRYLLDVIAFGGIIAVILYYLTQGKSLASILPVLSLFAVTGLKVLPAFQQIFANLSYVKTNMDALDDIQTELFASIAQTAPNPSGYSLPPWKPLQSIELKGVTFSYNEQKRNVIDELSLKIRVNSTVAIVGKSGSGKTTFADLLLGLIHPQQGEILVDGKALTKNNLRQWQDQIGYVPQTVYLSDASILANIALGTPAVEVDLEKAKQAAQMAELETFIQTLPHKYDTAVGERGVQLSGGQRQRIGIARALYHGASVLVFDEATSALDGITESSIMNAIRGLMGKKTMIIIAHRLSTVQECDQLILLENGKLAVQGTYSELLASSPQFQQMAKQSLQT
jgi:ATP-binding cassette, subfamily B, bacterial PglK